MDYHKRVYWPVSIGFDATEGEKHLRTFLRTQPGDPLDSETRLFLWHAFVEILNGEDPKKALRLETKQGTKGSAAKAKDKRKKLIVAVKVEEKQQSGMLKSEAQQAVADEIGVSRQTIERRYCTKENELLAKDMIRCFKERDENEK